MPERYSEDKLIVMLGGLHIEMGSLAMIGSWMEWMSQNFRGVRRFNLWQGRIIS